MKAGGIAVELDRLTAAHALEMVGELDSWRRLSSPTIPGWVSGGLEPRGPVCSPREDWPRRGEDRRWQCCGQPCSPCLERLRGAVLWVVAQNEARLGALVWAARALRAMEPPPVEAMRALRDFVLREHGADLREMPRGGAVDAAVWARAHARHRIPALLATGGWRP